MNVVEAEKFLKELKKGKHLDKNLEIVRKLIGRSNGWDSITNFIENNKDIKEHFDIVSRRLSNDQCMGYSTHIIEFIEELVDDLYGGNEYNHKAILALDEIETLVDNVRIYIK